MEEIKITVEISDIKLNIQCDPAWLTAQIGEMSERFPGLFRATTKTAAEPEPVKQEREKQAVSEERESLKEFLIKKEALDNQNRKFLATAIWLLKGGKKKLFVPDIRKALKMNGIPGIKFPGACRHQLKRRGFLSTVENGFSVSEKGMTFL